MRLGTTELVIILVIVILLFGAGRIGKIAGELGTGIKAFKRGIGTDEVLENEDQETNPDR